MENFQSLASKQGKIGEDLAWIMLQDAGFYNLRKEQLDIVEIDIVATNKHDIDFFFTVKASWRGDRQGLKRTDTLKKAVSDALMIYLATERPTTIITSHKPTHGRGKVVLERVPKFIVFDVIVLNDDRKRLVWMANATEDDIQRELIDAW